MLSSFIRGFSTHVLKGGAHSESRRKSIEEIKKKHYSSNFASVRSLLKWPCAGGSWGWSVSSCLQWNCTARLPDPDRRLGFGERALLAPSQSWRNHVDRNDKHLGNCCEWPANSLLSASLTWSCSDSCHSKLVLPLWLLRFAGQQNEQC